MPPANYFRMRHWWWISLFLANSAAAETSTTAILNFSGAQRPPPDPGGFPSGQPETTYPTWQIHGFLGLWWTPAAEDGRDPFRIRWASVRLDALPHPKVHFLVRVGFHFTDPPLQDMTATLKLHPAFYLTAGQMRIPLGAAITTLGAQLASLERPSYAIALSKANFRDVGVMVHSRDQGLAGFHYRLALLNGAGRLGTPLGGNDGPQDYLWMGRVMYDLLGEKSRAVLGLSYGYGRDPGLTGADAEKRAIHFLGKTVVPYNYERRTQIAGADLTWRWGGLWLQAEAMGLISNPQPGPPRRAWGASLELAYRLESALGWRVIGRVERFDPALDIRLNEENIFSAGLDIQPWRPIKLSVFGVFHDAQGQWKNELTFRALYNF